MTAIRLYFDADSMERGLLVAVRARSVDAITAARGWNDYRD